MTVSPGILARGPWTADAVEATWSDETWAPPAELTREADAAVETEAAPQEQPEPVAAAAQADASSDAE